MGRVRFYAARNHSAAPNLFLQTSSTSQCGRTDASFRQRMWARRMCWDMSACRWMSSTEGLSVCLSASLCLSVCLSFYLLLSVFLSGCLCLCMSIYLPVPALTPIIIIFSCPVSDIFQNYQSIFTAYNATYNGTLLGNTRFAIYFNVWQLWAIFDISICSIKFSNFPGFHLFHSRQRRSPVSNVKCSSIFLLYLSLPRSEFLQSG